VSASKRLRVRDEPGIGAFVVELRAEQATGPCPHLFDASAIARLRATKKIVADRAEAILEASVTMPPSEMHVSPI
jgi:hypothetical protein